MTDTADVQTLSRDPHRLLARLRSESPVAWIPDLGGWLVTGHQDAVDVLRDSERFTVDDPRFTTAQVVGESMLSTDGPDHRRHRTPFVGPLRPSAVQVEQAPMIRDTVQRRLDRIAPLGQAELRSQLCGPVAADIMASLTGLSGLGVDRLLRIYRDIVAGVDALSRSEDLPEAARHAVAQLGWAIEARTPSPALSEAAGLDPTELASNVAVMLFGGIETGEGMNACVLWYLLDERGLHDEASADPTLVPALIEEAVRLEPPAARVDRYATTDVTLAGIEIGRGDLVMVSITGANRDPAVFDDPDRFELGRSNVGKHLAFAVGPHACLGAPLAREETATLVRAAIDRLAGLRIERRRSTPHRGLVFRKPGAVWATWDA